MRSGNRSSFFSSSAAILRPFFCFRKGSTAGVADSSNSGGWRYSKKAGHRYRCRQRFSQICGETCGRFFLRWQIRKFETGVPWPDLFFKVILNPLSFLMISLNSAERWFPKKLPLQGAQPASPQKRSCSATPPMDFLLRSHHSQKTIQRLGHFGLGADAGVKFRQILKLGQFRWNRNAA